MSGDLEPLPARFAGRAGRGPGGAGGRGAGPVRAELPVIGGLAEREQVLVSAWLTGRRSARTRRACAGDVAGAWARARLGVMIRVAVRANAAPP